MRSHIPVTYEGVYMHCSEFQKRRTECYKPTIQDGAIEGLIQ